MRESAIEAYLVKTMEDMGGDCQKHVSPGRAGVVDRICIFPLGLPVWWVETKAPGKTPDPLQEYERDRLLKLGQRYALLDSYARIDSWAAQRRAQIAHLQQEPPK